MAIAFVVPNSKMPGLNFEAPPDLRSLEFLFDQVFSAEQLNRMQLLMGHYRTAGASYGVVDQKNPNSAGVGDPLCVTQNSTNLTVDVAPGVAVTKSGNVIVVTDPVLGLTLASTAITTNAAANVSVPLPEQFQGNENVVLLEYGVVDDPTTNRVTEGNTVVAMRRVNEPAVDPTLPIQSLPGGSDLNKPQIIKIVTIQDFLDLTKFTPQRLNEVVVLAIVKVVSNSSPPPTTTLSIDQSNAINTYVRPWFSPVDQAHREFVGTGSDLVPHKLSFNDLSAAALTLYMQLEQYGIIISRDRNVPGCAGKLCSELVDSTRILTDTDRSVTGDVNTRKYVRLNSYPERIIGIRANKIVSGDVVEDKSLTAVSVAAELIPNTNVLALGMQGSNSEVVPANGFTVYYTAADCLRPPALPHDIMLVANDIIQFQQPNANEEFVTGGKVYNVLPTSQYPVGTNGPIPKNYRLWLDASKQFVQGPQIVSCAKLINDATGVGTASQQPQFPMYGPARIRAALWNAPLGTSSLDVRVELSGTDESGASVVETLIFSWDSSIAKPQAVAWDQSGSLPASGEFPTVFQVSDTVFETLTGWQITQQTSAGPNALIQLWADIEPTTTPALDDALPICLFNWNGQSVARIRDIRPVTRDLRALRASKTDFVPSSLIYNNTSVQLGAESFKDPVMQDNILSKRDRHSRNLNTVMSDEALLPFNSDGTHPGREWYYSQAIIVPSGRTNVWMQLFGDEPTSFDRSASLFGSPFLDQMIVEYQTTTTSQVVSAWTATTAYNSFEPRIRQTAALPGGYYKIRFRVAGRHLSGFTLIA